MENAERKSIFFQPASGFTARHRLDAARSQEAHQRARENDEQDAAVRLGCESADSARKENARVGHFSLAGSIRWRTERWRWCHRETWTL